MKNFLNISIISFLLACRISANIIDPAPLQVIPNPTGMRCLINSAAFHPQRNLFCLTYTQGDQVVLYSVRQNNRIEIEHVLSNAFGSQLSSPQHAVFSQDGRKLYVVNWINRTLTVYCIEEGNFSSIPKRVIEPPAQFLHHKPHGMAVSPCGKFLAIAYGASKKHEEGIGLYRLTNDGFDCKLVCAITKGLHGAPKGIAFSPDGTALLVTFSDENCIVIYEVDKERINPTPRQVVEDSSISRPEDIKVTSSGNYCAISNSDRNNIAFYLFDQDRNLIVQSQPCFILKNPQAKLKFPHGIAFSSDGAWLVATSFGSVTISRSGDIFSSRDDSYSTIYRVILQ